MTYVKICGITNIEDAHVAAQAGADFLGFIFYEPSPRYVDPTIVKAIITTLQQLPSVPRTVGVFVNASAKTVQQTMESCHLDLAQLHGDEPPEFVQQFANRAYKALRPQSLKEAEQLVNRYNQSTLVNRESQIPQFLLDAYHPNLYGGTGQVTDWSMAAHIARDYPIMLAGSLTPANVIEAIKQVQPWGVDVSSGVEANKGKKAHEKVRAFVIAVKSMSKM